MRPPAKTRKSVSALSPQVGIVLIWSGFSSVACTLISDGLVVGKHLQDALVRPLMHTSRFDRHGAVCAPLEPSAQLLDTKRLNEIVDRTRSGGAEIVSLLKTGSAYYAPAAATTQMVEAVVRDQKRLVPCAAYCDKEYGVGGYYVGVPVILGARGVERIIELKLDAQEQAAFDNSVSAVKSLVKTMSDLVAKA